MLRKIEYKNSDSSRDSNNGQLLRDIEEISKALYLHKTPSNNSRSKSAGKIRLSESKSSLNPRSFRQDSLYKDKKSSSSVWNWKKPLKALTHIGNKKFHCCFYLHVHSIEGLPTNFDNLSLSVHWKRKHKVFQTSTSKISQGMAEFEETLMNQCSVYGSSGGPDYPMKYESKLFLLYASVIEAPDLDIGKQWVDVTSFLPRTLEELEGDKGQGQWSTSFNLSGKAKGASLNVSFGFSLMRDKLANSSRNLKFPDLLNMMQNSSSGNNGVDLDPRNHNRMHRKVHSFRGTANYGSDLFRQSLDVKVCREVLLRTGLELSNSLSSLYQKFDEGSLCISEKVDSEELEKHKGKLDLDFVSVEDVESYDWDITEFSVTEVGTEISEVQHLELGHCSDDTTGGLAIETINMNEIIKDYEIEIYKEAKSISKDDNCTKHRDEDVVDDMKDETHNDYAKGLTTQELGLACSCKTDLDPQVDSREYNEQENHIGIKKSYSANRSVKRSLSLDNAAESVATDFFNMLGLSQGSFLSSSDCDPESPRELLLRQFEEEALASGNFIFSFDAKHEEPGIGCSNAPGFVCGDHCNESALSLITYDAEEDHKRVSELLKRRKAKILEDLETEALMQQWGLNKQDFQNSPRTCSGGFGSPIELSPQELHPLPPLEEGFGAFVQMKNGGFLWSMDPSLFKKAKNVGYLIIHVSNPVILPAKLGHDVMEILQNMALVGAENLYEQINKLSPLENITGKAIKQVALDAVPSTSVPLRKALSQHDSYGGTKELDKSQSGWNNNNLVSSCAVDETLLEFVSLEDLSPFIVNKVEALFLESLKIQSRMSDEEPPSRIYPHFTRQMPASESTSDTFISDLLGLSVTFDEWLSLDSGNMTNEDPDSKHTLKTLAAHHAKCIDLVSGRLKQSTPYSDGASVTNCGLLGNNLIIAQLVQLRDPLRNYEPVGVPVLLLIDVQRRIFKVGNENKEAIKDNTRFQITGVHFAGVNTLPHYKQLWGTTAQQQSGTRWLLASGMARTVTGSKSKAIMRSSPLGMSKPQPEDILWSISLNFGEVGVTWKDLVTSHTRNPDVIFQTETTIKHLSSNFEPSYGVY